jgi:protein-tyrosine sulfotransferase
MPRQSVTAARQASSRQDGLLLDEPVIVLTAARHGSTLLRFILDTHPVLSCPPETNLAKAAVQLASTWRMLDGGESEPAPDAVRAVRAMADSMIGAYLVKHGKLRWCDKSLGTAEFAAQLGALYPRAKYICLYRHCMDMIASSLEACPWGVAGYGFDPYVSNSPGNNAAALAHYWADQTTAIIEFEQSHPESCFRVYYEQLTADPESVARELFSFLGVEPVLRISEKCFATEHDRGGPADYKIWATRKITADSVGRGAVVPIEVIPAPLLGVVNDLLGKLGYVPADEQWAKQGSIQVLHQAMRGAAGAAAGPAEAGLGRPAPAESPRISDFEQLERLLEQRVGAYKTGGTLSQLPDNPRKVAITAYTANGSAHRCSWQLDVDKAEVSRVNGDGPAAGVQIIGDSATWLSVLSGSMNLGVALRRGQLRYAINSGGADPRVDLRLSVAARLLGLAG